MSPEVFEQRVMFIGPIVFTIFHTTSNVLLWILIVQEIIRSTPNAGVGVVFALLACIPLRHTLSLVAPVDLPAHQGLLGELVDPDAVAFVVQDALNSTPAQKVPPNPVELATVSMCGRSPPRHQPLVAMKSLTRSPRSRTPLKPGLSYPIEKEYRMIDTAGIFLSL
ncbi:hypothetical protein CPB85DRAFT_1449425 [Mucidula mucida]|nr:hypothetical protein CPB85DRAFT_1449425 [Mucidula mucida]